MDDNDAWWNCPAFPTKCLWDNFRDAPMDGFADALARAMLETVAGDPGGPGEQPTEDVGAAMVGRLPKTGEEEDVGKVGLRKDFFGEAGYNGGNEATKEELDLYEDPCDKHACTIS